jgi:hypothetical protein
MKPKFLIASSQFIPQSGGVRVLHDLCDTLNRLGYEAGIAFYHGGNAKEQNFQWAISNYPGSYKPNMLYKQWDTSQPDREIREYLAEAIMIYPDLIIGNPLSAPRVVRYLLNRNEDSFADDFVLSFSKMYAEQFHATLFSVFSEDAIHANQSKHWSERTIDLTYIGKGDNFIETHKIPDTIILERAWPSDKQQLGILLRNSRFMFSWDCVSSTNLDAMICGCIPVLLHDRQINRIDLNKGELQNCFSISLSDLQDKNSVIYQAEQLDAELQETYQRYRYYLDSWDLRVQQFVEQCSNFYHL